MTTATQARICTNDKCESVWRNKKGAPIYREDVYGDPCPKCGDPTEETSSWSRYNRSRHYYGAR